jgi:hypothetical protein
MPKQDTWTSRPSALVTRAPSAGDEQYLMLTPSGQYQWTTDPRMATAFPSMREAARMAVGLPSGLRAFGLLRDIEVDAHRTLH